MTSQTIPPALLEDIGGRYQFSISWRSGADDDWETRMWFDPNLGDQVRIELDPMLTIVIEHSRSRQTGLPQILEIPVHVVEYIDVDLVEIRVCSDGSGIEEVWTPIARWVRHPDRGLLRFSEPTG